MLYNRQGYYEAAELLCQRALSITEKTPEHPNAVTVRENYVALLEQIKQAGIALSATE